MPKANRELLKLNFLLLLMFCVIPVYGQTNNGGSICLAAVDAPNDGKKSLSNPSGGNRVQVYEAQIDNKPKIKISNTNSIKISGLAVNKKHIVRIYGDGKVVESFKFSFSDFSSNKLCLWFKSLYETWSLWTTKDAGKICQCK